MIIPIKTDCRHFRADRPCTPHKQTGVTCPECPTYDPVGTRLLIVKLAADGDVLRTTSILPSLRRRFPGAHLTWLTESSAEPLLRHHPLIDRIWASPERCLPQLLAQDFDLVINPDCDAKSCALAALAKGKDRKGFLAGPAGEPMPLNEAAAQWHQMGLWDPLKRANRRTYQEIMQAIAELDGPIEPPQLVLTSQEIEDTRRHLRSAGWSQDRSRPVVGFNLGAGSRWPQKALPLPTIERVIEAVLAGTPAAEMWLLGGPDERERNAWLVQRFGPRVLDTGVDNTKRHFAALVGHVDVLVSADTLAMHIGIALGKHVIAHFGPTSPWEIDLFGRGEKIFPDTPHLACYCNGCRQTPHCNELITPDEVVGAIRRGLQARNGDYKSALRG
jgi:heptosyltransferase-2